MKSTTERLTFGKRSHKKPAIREGILGQERAKTLKIYLEFSGPNERDRALYFIGKMRNERQDFDENFLYLDNVSVDPQRPEEGIVISFKKNPPGLFETIRKIFQEAGFNPKESYSTLDDRPSTPDVH